MYITSNDYSNIRSLGRGARPLKQVSSRNGWVYCLTSPCEQYVKIGRTGLALNKRLSSLGSQSGYARSMALVWAVSHQKYEHCFHIALEQFRCKVVLSGSGKGGSKINPCDRKKTDHFTVSEARENGFMIKHNPTALNPTKAIYLPTIELFKISPDKAKQILAAKYPEAFQ